MQKKERNDEMKMKEKMNPLKRIIVAFVGTRKDKSNEDLQLA